MTQEELEQLSVLCLLTMLKDKFTELMTLATDLLECLCADCPPEAEGLTFTLPTERNAGQVLADSNDVGSLAAGWTAAQLVERVKTVDPAAAVVSETAVKANLQKLSVAGVPLVASTAERKTSAKLATAGA